MPRALIDGFPIGNNLIEDEGVAVAIRAKFNFTGTGVTVTDDAANDRIKVDIPGAGAGTAVDTYRFTGLGVIVTTTTLDGTWIPGRAGIITRVTLHRQTAGSAGSTIVDIHKNGTTIFTTQANRPTVTAAGGSDQIDAHIDMDVTAFAADDRITLDVDAAETGSAEDISVIIEVLY